MNSDTRETVEGIAVQSVNSMMPSETEIRAQVRADNLKRKRVRDARIKRGKNAKRKALDLAFDRDPSMFSRINNSDPMEWSTQDPKTPAVPFWFTEWKKNRGLNG